MEEQYRVRTIRVYYGEEEPESPADGDEWFSTKGANRFLDGQWVEDVFLDGQWSQMTKENN